ncbi:ABC transporter ATP-binding protein [Microbacter margulisiae]|uniref:Putative ABC transport system ATP-binding protein n=1 Tax=Microbacter margulisiae TaxID=1350067 RepID=A0A7W5DTX4_9PORP|nr:ABC transporter ATP-binding protein [Microbacter margulisiae]MBB3188158.1 putative ABC transport system ATP-binding protein [Microbacter margulisiae]
MNIIEIKEIAKTYDIKTMPVKALNGINLTFQEGEFTSIVGPSGSGKTTLLNILGGLDEPTEGEVIIDGQNITKLNNKKKTLFRMMNIGFVFQSFNLIPVLTVKENIEFIMQLQGMPRETREQRTLELLDAVGLADKINSRPNKLSGGQQQRVAVARALASKPKFILADEPTANLDSKSTENLLDIMEKLNENEHITFIFSTHDARVMHKAKRIITIEDGKVIKDVWQNNNPTA